MSVQNPSESLTVSSARDIYSMLMEAKAPDADAFDAHVIACILALSFAQAKAEQIPLPDAIGLDGDDLLDLVEPTFPDALAWLQRDLGHSAIVRGPDEICLLDLLKSGATGQTAFAHRLAALVARRAQRPNHLWQDLGLRHRGDLSELMKRHFAPLAHRNKHDMKWKKFLYRMICADAAFSLCTAPSCAECDDFETCFGDETGESLLARGRRAADLHGSRSAA
ncbi:nitrogen fixation protein NifQ [Rhodomicrobium vannielii ATCC 17100]|uniref:nitrogen fixation protein NifQ n=1 Tax=Rhodomicrobium vannielii TaxID=1069 RepID=UPI00191B62BB|nr:nitrogen fixation protein NifQ [Rhodomicrobium vannielii]MBJ7534018.1 nitrogen fixation protein NifQ [Rhodomicrobium vannielii ATCC 17100]